MTNNQNKTKVFLVIIAILIITNIAMLAFFLQKKGSGDHGRRSDRNAFIANFLQKEIGFNQSQLLQYDSLSKLYREKIRIMFENARNNKTAQFKQLSAGNFSDDAINRAADQSAATQQILEVQMFNHIKHIRLLCTKEQLPTFDSLFIMVFNRRSGERKRQ